MEKRLKNKRDPYFTALISKKGLLFLKWQYDKNTERLNVCGLNRFRKRGRSMLPKIEWPAPQGTGVRRIPYALWIL